MANENENNKNVNVNARKPEEIRRMYKDYEFGIRDDDNLATNAFCLIFGVQIEEDLKRSMSNAKKKKAEELSSFFKPTPDRIEQMKEMVQYRKKTENGTFAKWKDMRDFFDNEDISIQDEFHIISTIYQMINNDLLLVFFPSTSKE